MFRPTAPINTHAGTALGWPVGQTPAAFLCRSCMGLGLLLFFVTATLSASDCIPIHEASQHVGETKCISGTVHRVRVGTRGVHFIDFCEDQMACPFTIVVFPSDLKDVGDIRGLEGRTIEVHGTVKLYDGRAEIILNRISQIHGGAAMIPSLPKPYDVENRRHYSPRRLRPTKNPQKTKAAPATTAIYRNDVARGEPPH